MTTNCGYYIEKMYIKKVTLENFRNYDKQEVSFCDNINVIYGDNAAGKTNIVEAIFLCCMGKSFRASNDTDLVKFEKEGSKVAVDYEKKDRSGKISCNIEKKKTFFINGVKQNKISDVVGKLNCIIFTPDDISIVKDGPDNRRKFIDMLISRLKT